MYLLCLRDSKGARLSESEQMGLVGVEGREEEKLDRVGSCKLGEDFYCMKWEPWEGLNKGAT